MPPQVIHSDNIAVSAFGLCHERLTQALESRGTASLVLSGGSTPQPLYALLADSDLPWHRIHLFWGDERFVPHDDSGSNYGAARRVLIDLIDIPEGNVHPWPILDSARASAEAYSDILQSTVGPDTVFDLTLLGLGADGHTASLFPGTGVLAQPGLTVASRPDTVPNERLSLTAAALSNSRTVLWLVSGVDKSLALADLLADSAPGTGEYPARAISALDEHLLVTDLKV